MCIKIDFNNICAILSNTVGTSRMRDSLSLRDIECFNAGENSSRRHSVPDFVQFVIQNLTQKHHAFIINISSTFMLLFSEILQILRIQRFRRTLFSISSSLSVNQSSKLDNTISSLYFHYRSFSLLNVVLSLHIASRLQSLRVCRLQVSLNIELQFSAPQRSLC